jgi:hypothetical protein
MNADEIIDFMAKRCRETYMNQTQRDANPWDALTEAQRAWWRAPFVAAWEPLVDIIAGWITQNGMDAATAFRGDMRRE